MLLLPPLLLPCDAGEGAEGVLFLGDWGDEREEVLCRRDTILPRLDLSRGSPTVTISCAELMRTPVKKIHKEEEHDDHKMKEHT